MSQFIQDEAELSEGSNTSGGSQPTAKKPRRERKKRRQQISSDEEDEEEIDDDEKIREEMRGFVVEEDEVEDGGGEGDEDDDRGASDSDVSGDLEEEDLELLNENYGRTKGGRVQISDDEEDDRERIKQRIFGDVDDDNEVEANQEEIEQFDESRSESELSEDPFIVQDDDVDGARRKTKKKTKSTFRGQNLEDVRDIFGVEDINEFYEDDELIDEEELEQDAEGYPTKQKGVKVSLLDTIDPSELEKGFVSAEDRKIISEDRPERFQVRKIPVAEGDDHEIMLETAWIYEFAFRAPTMSTQHDIGLSVRDINKRRFENGELTEDQMETLNIRNEIEAPEKIREVLRFIRRDLFEVPFIAFYRKEYICFAADATHNSLLIPDLWKVYTFDEKWSHLQHRKSRILKTLERVREYIQTSGLPETEKLRRVTERDLNQFILAIY